MPTASSPARIMGIGVRGEPQMRRARMVVALTTEVTSQAMVPMRIRWPSNMEEVSLTPMVTATKSGGT